MANWPESINKLSAPTIGVLFVQRVENKIVSACFFSDLAYVRQHLSSELLTDKSGHQNHK